MKKLCTYNTFNESVRDMMKPKSEEDILKYVEGIIPYNILILGIENNVPKLIDLALSKEPTLKLDQHMFQDIMREIIDQDIEIEILELILQYNLIDLSKIINPSIIITNAYTGYRPDILTLLDKYGFDFNIDYYRAISLIQAMTDDISSGASSHIKTIKFLIDRSNNLKTRLKQEKTYIESTLKNYNKLLDEKN